MTDEHQTNAIIATAMLDSFRDHPDHKSRSRGSQNNCKAYSSGA